MATESTKNTSGGCRALVALTAIMIVMFPLSMCWGSVDIPLREIADILTGGTQADDVHRFIVIEARLPMAFTAIIAGASLSVAGLLMQTTFDNPLAGPSILGISTGSSLGVAVVLLAFGGSIGTGVSYYAGILGGAFAGAAVIMLLLLLFSSVVKSTSMLLIVGILTGYLASSVISLLNFFSTQEGVHSFVIWGMGNFSSLTLDRLPVPAVSATILLALSMLMAKPLNTLLLGARYAESLGVNIRRTRNNLLLLSGALTAVVTAFCGPIGFIGLVVPHIARMATRSSNHLVLLPATAVCGAIVAQLCTIISMIPSATTGIIPINAITPIIGVPIIIYIIVARRRLHYFN